MCPLLAPSVTSGFWSGQEATDALGDGPRVDGDPVQGLLCSGPHRDLECLGVRIPKQN